MVIQLTINEYFSRYINLPLIDVRSPGEFTKGHIPQANNVPLFSDSERAAVGTMYVRQSREKAIALGYEFVTPKLQHFIDQSTDIAPEKEVVVHCWRGGMRSAAFAKHLSDNGFRKVYLITGGYKAFRNHALKALHLPYKLKVLGGYTGSGKTHILSEISQLGHQIVDLEGLARHKGSAFGGLGMPGQPTVEQFENDLFEALRPLDHSKPIWVEDESQNIGKVQIPATFFQQIRQSRLYFVDIPSEKRVANLVHEYGNSPQSDLEDSINRIHKRLGGLATKHALQHISDGNYSEVARIALYYYDKSYLLGMSNRNKDLVTTIQLDDTDPVLNARIIMNKIESYV